MQWLRVLFILFCVCEPVFAVTLSVPFQIVTINPNQQLTTSYNASGHQGIFCYDDTFMNVGNVTFPYNGAQITAPLPIILTNNTDLADGYPADQSGTLYIFNTQTQPIYVSCEFVF